MRVPEGAGHASHRGLTGRVTEAMTRMHRGRLSSPVVLRATFGV